MRRLLSVLTLIIWGFSLYAQSGNIEITNVEHGYVSNGQSGLNIHCKINLYNCKGVRTNITAFFYEGSNGENGKLYGGISGYRAKDGQVCSFDDVTPRYDSSVWEDYKIFIPYSAIPHENETHFSFYVIARNHNTSTKYAESDWSNFHFNNTSNNNANYNQNYTTPCQVCFGSGRIQMGPMGPWIACTGCGGSGQWMKNVPVVPSVPQGGGSIGSGYSGGSNSNGNYNSGSRSSARDCGTCHGTRTCNNCGGKGTRVLLGTGSGPVKCNNCNGTGKCPWCNGTGKAR